MDGNGLVIVLIIGVIGLAIYGIVRYAQSRNAPYSGSEQQPQQPPSGQPPPGPGTRTSLLNNRYEITRHLATGGMANIDLARDCHTHSQYVVKTPRNNTEHDASINYQKLKVEADFLRQFNHPFILRFVDQFHCNHTPYLVVEYIDGADLKTRCEQEPADEGIVLAWAAQILAALDYIHKRGIIHRDINPGNIMLRQDKSIAIIDFGTAKSLHLSRLGSESGTKFHKRGFEVPELILDGIADERTDLCALGATIYYLLTSRTQGNHWTNPRDIATELMAQGVYERTARAIHQAMSHYRDDRFQDARALRRALGV